MRSQPSIEVRTFGTFQLLIGGKRLALPRHSPRRQMQLLKVLVALGGQAVSIERVSEALWPDADGDKALKAFHSALHRLRERLPDNAISVSDGRVSLERRRCRVDVLEFLAAIDEARQALEREDLDHAVEQSDRALRIYAAPFLDGEFEPSPLPAARTRLHGLFLRHVERMGQVLSGGGRHEQALAVYRGAMAIDPGAEEIVQALIRCCVNLGRYSEGLTAFETLRQTLREQYGVEPTEASLALHRALLEAARAARPEPAAPPVSAPATSAETAAPTAARPAVFPERRPVTVLASRLTGLEGLDVEDAERLLVRVKEQVHEIVLRHGGVVNRLDSDGLVALFGVAPAHDDDPMRAVHAALALHAALHEPRIPSPLRVCTGIATGLALVHAGEPGEGPYHLTGTATQAAARLQAQAGPAEILLSGDTRRQVADFFALEARSLPPEAGENAPQAWSVAGETPVRTRFQAAERRGFTPYVGREHEREALRQCLQRALAGDGQLVTVSGEAGMGKSRLVYELRRSVDPERVAVLEGRCQSYDAQTPYLPFLDALREGLQLSENDLREQLQDKVAEAIRAIDPALEKYLPHYLHLLSIPSGAHRLPESLQGEALRRELEESLAAGLTLFARRKPLVLILEDWHWVDEASESALRHLIGLIPLHPLMAIVLYRPEQYEPAWGQRDYGSAIRLHPLEVQDTARMFRFVLGTEELPDGLMPRVHERTGGNAFFNEEMALALLEMGLIVVEGERAKLSKAVDEIDLPDTVQATLRARVDRLDPEDREVLRLASVIGREFDRAVLEKVAPSAGQVGAALERLARQELVLPVRLLPQAEFMFKHVLTQEVVYETLLLSQRKQLHEHVGVAIEALYADRLEEQYEALAHHYSESANIEKAIEYLEKAGDKAAEYFSMAEARKHFRESLRLLDLGAMTEAKMRMRIALNLKWSGASHYAPGEEQVVGLNRSLDFARKLEDAHLEAQVRYWIGRVSHMQGYLLRALPHFQHCLKYAEEQGDRRLLGQTYNMIGRTHSLLGKNREATAFLQRGILLARQEGDMVDVCYSIGFLCQNLAMLGEFKEAHAFGEEAVELARSIGNKTREASAYHYLGYALLEQGLWKELLEVCDRGMEISARTGEDLLYAQCEAFMGYGTFLSGDRNRGIALIREGIQRAESVGANIGATFLNGLLAECCALQGLYSVADLCAEKAINVHRDTGEEYGLPLGYRALAMAEASRNPMSLEVVTDHTQQSLALTRRSGARPMHAITHFRYAEILHKRGDLPAALEQLSAAEKLFAEMEMTWWSGQAAGLRGRIEGGKPFVWFAPYVDGPPVQE